MLRIIWYRTKVMRILYDEYAYQPAVPGWQTEGFNRVTRHIKERGGNEYDGACAFMLVQISVLNQISALDRGATESQGFIERIERTTARLLPRGRLSAEAVAEAERT
ncbi:MAG: hypothetical protein ABL996_02735 [Micropepsaceae bacterium]